MSGWGDRPIVVPVPPAGYTGPMTPDQAFLQWCIELLSPLGRVRSRRMFGGQGLYVDELFMALIMNERLYLKVDDETQPR